MEHIQAYPSHSDDLSVGLIGDMSNGTTHGMETSMRSWMDSGILLGKVWTKWIARNVGNWNLQRDTAPPTFCPREPIGGCREDRYPRTRNQIQKRFEQFADESVLCRRVGARWWAALHDRKWRLIEAGGSRIISRSWNADRTSFWCLWSGVWKRWSSSKCCLESPNLWQISRLEQLLIGKGTFSWR